MANHFWVLGLAGVLKHLTCVDRYVTPRGIPAYSLSIIFFVKLLDEAILG